MVKALKRFHLTMLFVWAGLAVSGILWWRDSILIVIVGGFAVYQAARAEAKQDEP